MLHQTRFLFGRVLGNAQNLGEELTQKLVALEHRRTIAIAVFRQRDVAG